MRGRKQKAGSSTWRKETLPDLQGHPRRKAAIPTGEIKNGLGNMRKLSYGRAVEIILLAVLLAVFAIFAIAATQLLYASWRLNLAEDPYNRSITDDYCVKTGYEYMSEAAAGVMRCCKITQYVDTILGKLPLKTVCSGLIVKDGWK